MNTLNLDQIKSAAGLPATPRQVNPDTANDTTSNEPAQTPPWFNFLTPAECRDWQAPEGHILVGNCHIVRGSKVVIGGAPGIGKSRAGNYLALAGATGADWFDLKVHKRFRTAILQAENGRHRLRTEFAELNTEALNDYVRISDCPPFGLAFNKPEFRESLAKWLDDFKPDVLVIDPWNSVASDDGQRDYREAFNFIDATCPHGDKRPAVVIIAHTRKPKDEKGRGRGLLHELSGSHALGSVPRCVFVMQAASDDETDDRIVWTCCKNNDGELGERSAWHRRNGLFAPCADFDWQEFDGPAKDGNRTITKANLDTIFNNGNRKLTRKTAAMELEKETGFTKTAAYNALKLDGRFKAHLAEADGLLTWTP